MFYTNCPYCGEKISYFTMLREKNQGEHFCENCRKESKICIQKRILAAFLLTLVLAIVIAVLFEVFNKAGILQIILTALPFVAFFLISPIFIVLRPYRKYKEWKKRRTRKKIRRRKHFTESE